MSWHEGIYYYDKQPTITTSTVFGLLISCLRIGWCNHQEWVELLLCDMMIASSKGQVSAKVKYAAKKQSRR